MEDITPSIERVLTPKRPGQRRYRYRCLLGHLHWSERAAECCADQENGSYASEEEVGD